MFVFQTQIYYITPFEEIFREDKSLEDFVSKVQICVVMSNIKLHYLISIVNFSPYTTLFEWWTNIYIKEINLIKCFFNFIFSFHERMFWSQVHIAMLFYLKFIKCSLNQPVCWPIISGLRKKAFKLWTLHITFWTHMTEFTTSNHCPWSIIIIWYPNVRQCKGVYASLMHICEYSETTE